MRTLKIALFTLVLATTACKKKEGDKAAEPAKAGDTAKAVETAKPADKPAEPAAAGGGCADLKVKVCEGLDATKCGTWLDKETSAGMNEGETLSPADQAMACKMILGDAAALEAYKTQAKEKSQ